jgi:membrane fusion protein, multidrug efflux system
MKRVLKWSIGLLVAILAITAMVRTVSDRQAARREASVPISAAVLELTAADLVEARRHEIARSLRVSGSLQALDTSLVRARVAGELRSLGAREGDPVVAGQVIGQQDDTEYTARLEQALQQAESARAQVEIADRTLQNNRALVDRGFISKNALDTSVSNAAAARANLLAAEAAARVARKAREDSVLRAPISGQVSQRFVQPGERLSVDARILEIVDLSRIELAAAIAPEAIASVPIGASAQLQVDGIAEPVRARVARINPAATAGTRSVTAYLDVQRHPALRHGLFATGQIETGRIQALAVPETAIRNDRSAPYVLVVRDGRISRQDIVTGVSGRSTQTPDTVIAIEQGLAEGAILLAGPVGVIEDGTAVRITGPAGPAR